MILLPINDFLDKVYKEGISESDMYTYVREKTNVFDESLLCQLINDLNNYCNENIVLAVEVNKLYFCEKGDFYFPDEDYAGFYSQDFKISNFFQFLRNKHSMYLEERRRLGFDIKGNDTFEIESCTSEEREIKECTSIKSKIAMLNAYPEVSFKNNYSSLIKLSNLLEYQCKMCRKDNVVVILDVAKFETKSNLSNVSASEVEEDKSDCTNKKSLRDLFSQEYKENWQMYVDALTQCNPPLLKKENDMYKFIGNSYSGRGCAASWFKYLKSKRIIDIDINRNELASILCLNILNFVIAGCSIDNKSETYKRMFEKQLVALINKS